MKTTKEKIAVMQAYEDGRRIRQIDIKSSLNFLNICKKETEGIEWLEVDWDWVNYDYEIVEEPKPVPFDIQDYESILGKKIRHVKKSFTGILTMVCSDERKIVIANKEFSISLASEHLFWYNETVNDWLPCMKTTTKIN